VRIIYQLEPAALERFSICPDLLEEPSLLGYNATMKALFALVLLFTTHAFAQNIPNMQGNYVVIPNACNFVGIAQIRNAVVQNVQGPTGPAIVIKIIGLQAADVAFSTVASRVPNPLLQVGSPIQFIDTDVLVSQTSIGITNTIHDEYKDGHKELEAMLSLVLTGNKLDFIANEGSGLQETCSFIRTQ
jgi:hypothetical protein